jgi:hypothetical protein
MVVASLGRGLYSAPWPLFPHNIHSLEPPDSNFSSKRSLAHLGVKTGSIECPEQHQSAVFLEQAIKYFVADVGPGP